jgi:predicted Zn-dependent protease
MKSTLRIGLTILAAVPLHVTAQEPVRPKASRLDSRSVLVAWTNDAVKGLSPTQAVKAVAKTLPQPAEATNTPTVPSGDPELDRQVQEASKIIRSGKTAEGMKILRQVLAKDPKHRNARFELGTIYIQLGQYAEAVSVFETMVAEYPKDYSLKNNLSWIYATARDPAIRNGAKAIRLAQDALFDAPGDFHVWSTLCEAYYVSGQYDKAMRAAEEALRLATLAGAAGLSLEEYRQQVRKSQKAVEALSVLE